MRLFYESLAAFAKTLSLYVLVKIWAVCCFIKLNLALIIIWKILSIPYNIFQHFLPNQQVNLNRHAHSCDPKGRWIIYLIDICFLPYNAYADLGGSSLEHELERQLKKIFFTFGWIASVAIIWGVIAISGPAQVEPDKIETIESVAASINSEKP